MMSKCNYCGGDHPEDALFCPVTGKALEPESSQPGIIPKKRVRNCWLIGVIVSVVSCLLVVLAGYLLIQFKVIEAPEFLSRLSIFQEDQNPDESSDQTEPTDDTVIGTQTAEVQEPTAAIPTISGSPLFPQDQPTETPDVVLTAEPVELHVWSFTNELQTMAIAFEEQYPNVDVVFTMISLSEGEYQASVKAALGTESAPDVVSLEAAFVTDWIKEDFLADLNQLLPLADELGTYPYLIEASTYEGVTKAYSYQASPGAFFYRRSIAQDCLGTDDPAQVQMMVADLEAFIDTAAAIRECSDGDTYIVPSAEDLYFPFLANRAQPWVVDGALVIDPMVEEFVSIAKLMRDQGYVSQTYQWSSDWFDGMSGRFEDVNGTPRQIFGYFLPTWGLPYLLMPNSGDTGGDWAMVEGPLPYYWGGTWLGVIADSPNLAWAKEFVRFATLDEGNLTNWATGVYTNDYLRGIDPTVPADQAQPPGDFVSSQVVVNKITPVFNGNEAYFWLGGQNSYQEFSKAASNIDRGLITEFDYEIQYDLQSLIVQYLDGGISKDQMWQSWLDQVQDEFPDLTIPDPPTN